MTQLAVGNLARAAVVVIFAESAPAMRLVLYRLVLCVLLPYCHVLKQKMKYQWYRRMVEFDFLRVECHDHP